MELHRQPSFLSLLNPFAPALSLWRHRGLLRQFTVRNVEMRHKGSILGIVWAVLNPLLTLAVYVFVFGFVFGGSFGVVENESRWDYGLGIFLGLAIFQLVAEAITVAPSLITTHQNFVKKVVFPLEILPAAAVGAGAFHMLITLAMVAIGVVAGGRALTVHALQLPIIILPILITSLGLAWLLAALGVFFRDLAQVVGALASALMFASAIFYPAIRVATEAPTAWAFLKFNPLLHTVEMAREAVLWSQPVFWPTLGWLYLGAGLTASLGYACFIRLKPAFADVI
ncbi:MAG: ABC transporter permease [Verrucomicrobia bacterium]|nr:MAG: ABC transporter permease [Verrucomicrobiota bacterium]